MIFAGILLLAAAADQTAKTWVESEQDFPRPLKGTGGRIVLHKNHNPGFPFGLLKERKGLVRTLPLTVASALGGVFLYLQKEKKKPAARLALALVLGGAFSNIYDRYVRGYVVDYFSVRFGSLKKVVWNLGDVFIFLGSGILAFLNIVGKSSGPEMEK